MTSALLTAREAAEYLRVSEDTVRSLSHRGELPCIHVTPRNIRWYRADLDAFIERRREEFPTVRIR